MSCLGPYYLPRPPREWSRVQNACVYYNDTFPNYVTVPLIQKQVPFSALYSVVALINKGNVLQYKGNSSRLTKQEIYSKIARGKWTNRTTTWATQSDKYSNPNTNHLKRVGGEWVNVLGQGAAKPSCQPPQAPVNFILPTISPQPTINPVLPPPPVINPNPSNNNAIPLVPLPTEPEPEVILDFGNLICNTTENICTGETFTQPANSNWHPTTDSDVPGPITELYWDSRIQTWFPRQRLTMNNSTDKWPYNAKAIFPVDGFQNPYPNPNPPINIYTVPGTPIIEYTISGDESVTLVWIPPLYDGGTPITEYIITYTEIATTPGQTFIVNVIPGNESVTLIWNPPLDDGGTPITEYIISYAEI